MQIHLITRDKGRLGQSRCGTQQQELELGIGCLGKPAVPMHECQDLCLGYVRIR